MIGQLISVRMEVGFGLKFSASGTEVMTKGARGRHRDGLTLAVPLPRSLRRGHRGNRDFPVTS